MSNFLALATVTASLRQTLQEAASVDVPGAVVTTTRPETARTGNQEPAVNLYLYQVTTNAAWSNRDLPARGPDGRARGRSRVALDLHYLVSFYGNETRLEPQRLMGSVIRTLHEHAELSRAVIERTITDKNLTFLAKSDLANEVELVKLTRISLSLEELSKLWSVLFQTPHALSVVYTGTVVLIDGLEAPHPALPVRSRQIRVGPFMRPTIESVISEGGADRAVLADSRLRILGSQLHAETSQVRIGVATLIPQQVGEGQLIVDLGTAPSNSLRAGVQAVQLISAAGSDALGAESNAYPIILRPTVTGVSSDPLTARPSQAMRVTVRLCPSISKEQRVMLFLRPGTDGEAPMYVLSALAREKDSDMIEFSASLINPGTYLVTVQVDGAESPLEIDINPSSPTFGCYVGPKLTLGSKPVGGPLA